MCRCSGRVTYGFDQPLLFGHGSSLKVLSQTQFVNNYTGKHALTGCCRSNKLALPSCPDMLLKNAYTSSLRQNRSGSVSGSCHVPMVGVPRSGRGRSQHCDVAGETFPANFWLRNTPLENERDGGFGCEKDQADQKPAADSGQSQPSADWLARTRTLSRSDIRQKPQSCPCVDPGHERCRTKKPRPAVTRDLRISSHSLDSVLPVHA